jgi:hypothetical protein
MRKVRVAFVVCASVIAIASVGLAQEQTKIEPMPGEVGYASPDIALQPPVNDLCADAITIAVPSLTAGTTVGATLDNNAGFCGTGLTTAGVWYMVVGTGNTMTAGFCTGSGTASYDTKLFVYCDTCSTKTCVGGNDDTCGLLSEVTWCSQAGFQYLIYVSGFGGQTGTFSLDVFDDGTPCPDPGICSNVPVELMNYTIN